MKVFHYLVLMLIGLTSSCQSTSVSPSGEKIAETNGVALYLITTPVNLSTDATALDKVPLTLANEPLIGYEQIESYAANTHTFQLSSVSVEKLKALSSNIPLSGIPFALVVDGTIVYQGLFWNPISSLNTAYPYVVLDKTVGEEITVEFRSSPPGGINRIDLRNDTRLLDRLKKDAKLK